MGLIDKARSVWRDVRHRDRRIWVSPPRTHLEARDVPIPLHASFAAAVEASFASLPGVVWARYNAPMRRVIVEGSTDVGSLASTLEELEQRFDLSSRDFVDDNREHPGDREPLDRTKVEIGSDLLALGLGVTMRLARVPVSAAEVDFAAVLAAIDGLPGARELVERRLGKHGAELALNLATSLSSALMQGASGPASDIVHKYLRLKEHEARQAAWAQEEAELCADPDKHPPEMPDIAPRPQPLPPGPIERYAEKATFATIGGFGFGLASSHSLEGATASIFGGIPKPAFRGREAFAYRLATHLSERGVLVLDRQALRRLDRVDTLVIGKGLIRRGTVRDPDLDNLVGQARHDGLRVVVVGDAELASRIRADVVDEDVRTLQAKGDTVLYVGTDPQTLPAADVSVGIPNHHIPFSADVVCKSLRDALMIVSAVKPAQAASKQSVQFAIAEAAIGVLLSLSGLQERTTRRVMLAANATSLLAMANGVRIADSVMQPPEGVRPPLAAWHAMSAEQALAILGSSSEGLREEIAGGRHPNPPEPKTRIRQAGDLLAAELANPFTPILGVGASLSALMGQYLDAAMVGGVVGLNAVLGAVQRYRTEKSLESLFEEEQRDVSVRRNGEWKVIDDADLVFGDVIQLRAGEVVPADCRILECDGLEVDESSLTGESLPVVKAADAVEADAVAERTSMLYSGTMIAAGEVVAVCTATGPDTEAERAAWALGGDRPRGVEARLEALTALTAPAAAAAGLVVVAAGTARNQPPADVIGAGVSLAVAAVPEGLPLLATMAQLAAAKRLSEKGVVVRHPRAVEALGRLDVLCADKTGTLTEGRIRLREIFDGRTVASVDALSEAHRRVVAVATRATPALEDGPLPHLTDQALAQGAADLGVRMNDGADGWATAEELPFEPGRGYHAVAGSRDEGDLLCVKGAPEIVLPLCDFERWDGDTAPLSETRREEIHEAAGAMASRGLRVLAIADRTMNTADDLDEGAVRRLRFRGFVGLSDPVRDTAAAALSELKKAGVDTIMITGDHPRTAQAIGAELGLASGGVLTGPELEILDDTTLAQRLESVRVVARVTPAQKVRIVRALQVNGKTVGMTGDGANDAQAIRLADVGIALGDGATGAARHAADLVVVDGRVESIVTAVLEGRALWRGVRDAVAVLVGGNLGEIGFAALGGLLGGRVPLNTRQLLLVNILTDALPALAIALKDPKSFDAEELFEEGPERSLGERLDHDIAWRGALTGGTAAAAWTVARLIGDRRGADTVALLSLVGAQLGQTLVAGGRSPLVLATGLGSLAALLGIVQTPGLSRFFGSRPLGPIGLSQAATAAVAASAGAWVLPKILDRVIQPKEEPETEEGEVAEAPAERMWRWVSKLSGRLSPTS